MQTILDELDDYQTRSDEEEKYEFSDFQWDEDWQEFQAVPDFTVGE